MPECNWCSNWVNMCHKAPCHGTAEDMACLIQNWKISSLVLQVGMILDTTRCISVLVPAPEWAEWKIFMDMPLGKCSLLRWDNMCSIHGIKPLIWRESCCKKTDMIYEWILVRESWRKSPLATILVHKWWEYHRCNQLVEEILSLPSTISSWLIRTGGADNATEKMEMIRNKITTYNFQINP